MFQLELRPDRPNFLSHACSRPVPLRQLVRPRPRRGSTCRGSPRPFPTPRLLFLNHALAEELGLDGASLDSPEGSGRVRRQRAARRVPSPSHMAYAGHQLGNYSPRLGDGCGAAPRRARRRPGATAGTSISRAPAGRPSPAAGTARRRSGRCCANYVIGEAMHALGIPTTCALAVVATGESIAPRDGMSPAPCSSASPRAICGSGPSSTRLPGDGALRGSPTTRSPGTRQTRCRGTAALLALLELCLAPGRARRPVDAGRLVHGVMNTDNMAISGETIDFALRVHGGLRPATVFSSIDQTAATRSGTSGTSRNGTSRGWPRPAAADLRRPRPGGNARHGSPGRLSGAVPVVPAARAARQAGAASRCGAGH